jgi:protoporphyrinogen/coproporphyrinogen III oxidase
VTSPLPAVVVGGGISGLVCAYALRKAGIEAQLFEASERAGGLIRSEGCDGFLLEMGPQSLSGTAALRSLCAEIGIAGQIVQASPSSPRYVVIDGKLQSVPLSLPGLLKSSLLGMRTKLSLGRDALGNSKPPEEDESVADFVRRKFTPELLDRLAGPFISGIYAGDPERLSLRAAFPQVHEAEKSAGSVIRGLKRLVEKSEGPRERPTLFSFREGTELLVRTLRKRLGAAVQLRTEVTCMASDSSGDSFELALRSAGQESSVSTKCLIVATPTDVAGRLLAGLNPEFDGLLSEIAYAPVATVALGYRRVVVGHSLDGFGFLVPRSAGLRTLGTVWNSSLFPGGTPEGYVLLTSFVGGATDPDAVKLPTADLAALVHRQIAALLQIREGPGFSHASVYPRALPQYNLGHVKRLAALEELRQRTPGLWLAGNYLRGPAVGACVEQSLSVSQDVLSHLQR